MYYCICTNRTISKSKWHCILPFWMKNTIEWNLLSAYCCEKEFLFFCTFQTYSQMASVDVQSWWFNYLTSMNLYGNLHKITGQKFYFCLFFFACLMSHNVKKFPLNYWFYFHCCSLLLWIFLRKIFFFWKFQIFFLMNALVEIKGISEKIEIPNVNCDLMLLKWKFWIFELDLSSALDLKGFIWNL